MSKNLIFSFTLDYELLGNGDGDVYELMINPTNKFLKVCDKYNVKTTIFFEVVEYWKIKEAFQNGNLKNYKKDPTIDIEEQLKNAIKKGHDVQLHIHPQWLDAKYNNEKWSVNDNLHRLPDLARYNRVGGYTISSLIRKGKETLEDLFKPINDDYRCHIFRAGGLNIYPSENILNSLRKNCFDTDSSVLQYAFADTNFTKYNYKHVTNKDLFWITKSGVLTEPQNINGPHIPFLELPIYSLLLKRYQKYDFFRLYNKLFNKKATSATLSRAKDKLGGKNIIERIKFFFEEESLTWDFCLFSKAKHIKYLKSVKGIIKNLHKEIYPIILIGHSKEINYYNLKTLDWLFGILLKENIEIQSLNYISKNLFKNIGPSF